MMQFKNWAIILSLKKVSNIVYISVIKNTKVILFFVKK